MFLDTILEILGALHPDIDFTTHEKLIDDNILDSFDIVSIIAEINDKLDVTITADEIIPDNFNSAQLLFALVERLSD